MYQTIILYTTLNISHLYFCQLYLNKAKKKKQNVSARSSKHMPQKVRGSLSVTGPHQRGDTPSAHQRWDAGADWRVHTMGTAWHCGGRPSPACRNMDHSHRHSGRESQAQGAPAASSRVPSSNRAQHTPAVRVGAAARGRGWLLGRWPRAVTGQGSVWDNALICALTTGAPFRTYITSQKHRCDQRANRGVPNEAAENRRFQGTCDHLRYPAPNFTRGWGTRVGWARIPGALGCQTLFRAPLSPLRPAGHRPGP